MLHIKVCLQVSRTGSTAAYVPLQFGLCLFFFIKLEEIILYSNTNRVTDNIGYTAAYGGLYTGGLCEEKC